MLSTVSRSLGLTRRELVVLAAAFVLTLPAVTPRIYASDEIQYFSYLRSLWFDGDVSFENEYRHFYDRTVGRGENFHATFLERETETGRRPNFGTMGAALLWAPFYGAGHLVALMSGADADGYSRPYVAAVAYGSAFYGFAALVLAAATVRAAGAGADRVLRGSARIHADPSLRGSARIDADLTLRGSTRMDADPSLRGSTRMDADITDERTQRSPTPFVEPRQSAQSAPRTQSASESAGSSSESAQSGPDSAPVIAAILVWIGTPLLFYMYIAPPYAHACSAFAVALFLFVWLRVRRNWTIGGAVALGLCGALVAMVREQDVLFALGPAGDLLLTMGRAWRSGDRSAVALARYVKVAAAGTVAFVLGYTPQLLAYQALNGYPGPSRLVVRKMSWHSPHALQVLGSPEHGFLLWTPLAIGAIAGLVALAWWSRGDRRRIAGLALFMLALQVYVSGSVESWTVAGAFGQRRFVAVTVLLTIGLAAVLRSVPRGRWRVAMAVALALCVWWNLALTAAFGTGLMNRQRLELARNAYDAFVTIPSMAPELAVRYLTERESFYRQRSPEP